MGNLFIDWKLGKKLYTGKTFFFGGGGGGVSPLKLGSYGVLLAHIFKILGISNEKPSISIEIPSILIKNLGFRSKC